MQLLVFFPTNNIGKYNRYKSAFRNKNINYKRYYVDQNNNEIKINVIEDGQTQEENAEKKAKQYYDEYIKYIGKRGFAIISTDEALYIDGLKDDEQPGMYVRRLNKAKADRATDEEVLSNYTEIVRKLGGEVKARWKYSLVMFDGFNYHYYNWEEPVLLSDTPHYPMTQGYVLNNITIVKKECKNLIMLSDLTERERDKYLSKYTNNVGTFVRKQMLKKSIKKAI